MTAAAAANRTAMIRLIWRRDLWNSSMQLATSVSMMEIQEVRAANATMMKKTRPISAPARPIALNTFGRDTNIRLGPEAMPSVPENTNTAGMIISPARNATPVSKNSIWLKERFRFTSFFT